MPDHTLVRCIGRGSYGEVWLARSALGTWRAVKIVQRSAFDADRPYEREFAGIQRFEPISRSHESQLNILQVGRVEGGFYYVMELADDMGRGRDIDEGTYKPRDLRSELHLHGRLPASDCLRLGLALTTALEHLHKHGLVHRDIKPSNIVFVNGIPKLADIGLVARAEATMSFVGTEGFVPPEGPGTPQADIYSLGKVLYELSTGHDRHQFPELPTELESIPNADQLGELNEILLRACQRDPAKRYRTAAEMHADLALLDSGRSVVRLRGIERRLRFIQRAGAAVAAIAVLVTAGWWWQAKQTRFVRELAEQKSQLAEEKTRLAELNRERVVRLDIANGIRLLDEGNAPGALLWFADALPLLAHSPASETIHRIRIQQTLDQIPRLVQVMAHESQVYAGDFSPDGRLVATGTLDGKLRIWEVSSGAVVYSRDMGDLISQVRFSADGRRLLLCSAPALENSSHGIPYRGFVAVLDAASGQEIFPRLTSNLVSVAFSPDGRWLAAAKVDHVIRLFDTQEGQLVTELKGHTDEVIRISFAADGMLLASGSRDRTARLWKLPSGEPVGPPLQHEAPVFRAILSDDSRCLLTSTELEIPDYDCEIQTWDVQRGHKIGPPLKERTRVNGLFFERPDAKRFFSAGMGSKLKVWDREQHTEAMPAIELQGEIATWAFSNDGSLLAVSSSDGADPQVVIRHGKTGEAFMPPLRHTAMVTSFRFAPDGKLCLTVANDGAAKLWAVGLPVRFATAHCDMPLSAQYAHRMDRDLGRQPGAIPIFTRDGGVRLFDPDRWSETHRLIPSNGERPPNRCIVAPTGHLWATFNWIDRTNSSSPTVDLWREKDNALEHLTLTHPNGVSAVAFLPDEAQVLTAGRDGHIRTWQSVDGALKGAIPLPQTNALVWAFSSDATRALLVLQRCGPGQINDLLQVFDIKQVKPTGPPFQSQAGEDFGFDPSGNHVASVGQDAYLRIFDARTGELVSPPCKYPETLLFLDWSMDGRRVLASGFGRFAMICDAATGEQMQIPMRTGTRNTLTARWSPDGRFIVTRNNDGKVRLWDGATAEAITPLLSLNGYIRLACITRSSKLFTLSDPDVVRAWDLKATPLPPDVIADYAKLSSGRKLSAAGALLPMKAQELAELRRSLNARAPDLFASP